MKMEFFTIGVFNSTRDDFFNKLIENRIDTFYDIRQRRGVRGPIYSFVNSIRLQNKLNELEITYEHIIELAPLREIRELQNEVDILEGVTLRSRIRLDKAFIKDYKSKVLKDFDFNSFIENLEKIGARRVVLFCVEERPEACHRSIVADELKEKYGYKTTHL